MVNLKLSIFNLLVIGVFYVLLGCNSSSKKHKKNTVSFQLDTVIHGIHIKENGRLPQIKDFITLYKGIKSYHDTLKHMKKSDKDSVKAAYKRFFEEARKKEKK